MLQQEQDVTNKKRAFGSKLRVSISIPVPFEYLLRA